ncbi:class I SAM-dependent methyltransferase [Sodalis sp. C49]|uniref:class I SAM-dependent methyltransferase n=1 Tax=unclassified Sodalis (in: enterobacteria) TaxID=2636512 RepID=UPI0039659AF8
MSDSNSQDNNIGQESATTFDPATFDEYAELYDSFSLQPYRTQLETPTIKFHLGKLSGKRIMDFGCGPGFYARWLIDNGAKEVFGYDISKGMLDHAIYQEKKDGKGITFLSHLDESLNNTFDIVLSIYVIPYINSLEDLSTLFMSFASLLKPGGKLITLPLHPDFNTDPLYYLPFGFSLTETEARADGSKVGLHLHKPPYDIDLQTYYWSAHTLESTLAAAGFNNILWRPLIWAENTSAEDTAFLQPYQQQPHAAIIECTRG